MCLVTQLSLTFVTPWTIAYQAPLSMGFSRQEAISFSRGSSQPRDWTQVSHIAVRFFTIWATNKCGVFINVFYKCILQLCILQFHLLTREGNGNPLQCSCLKNSMERGPWWTTVHGIRKSDRTQQLSLGHSPFNSFVGNNYLIFNMDCSPPGSSVHGILQARTLERVAISFSN